MDEANLLNVKLQWFDVDNNVVGGVVKVKWVIANESGVVSREALSGNRARI
jgi:hypothetical protein